MRRLTTLFSLTLIVIIVPAAAQSKVELGLKGGWNFANMTGVSTVVNGTKNSSAYHFGGYGLIKLSKMAIQPEVIYSKQGETYAYTGSTYGSEIDYLNVPIMIRVVLAEALNIQVGPQIGFVIKATGSLRDETTGAITTNQDVKSYLTPTDFAIGAGVGWDFPFGVNLTARYNIGISNINRYSGGTVPNNVTTWMGTSKSTNQVFQLSIGYRLFRIGD